MKQTIAIIGGGAAGCFCAIAVKRLLPHADVTVYEGGRKALAKVAVTGGGRCNLTNSFRQVEHLAAVYPRGEKLMKRLLKGFSAADGNSRYAVVADASVGRDAEVRSSCQRYCP